jgi:predicted dehydrogenase
MRRTSWTRSRSTKESGVKPLQIAVIGAGHLGRIHAKLLAQVDGVELVAITDPFPAAREQAKSQFNVATFESHLETLASIDAAIVSSPTAYHAETVAELLLADKHVFVEKPITIGTDEASDLVRLASMRRRTLQVGHVERFNPAWTAAAEVTSSAKYVEAVRASRFPGRCLDVGVVLDLMIHDIDLVLSLTDAPLKSVSASGVAVVSNHEDMAEARLEFECGMVANLKASRISPTPARQMKTFGPNGFAEIDFGSLALTLIEPHASLTSRTFDLSSASPNPLKFADTLFSDFIAPRQVTVEPRNAILDELHDFVISIQSKTTPTVSGAAGARAVDVANQILASIDARQWSRSDQSNQRGPHAMPAEGIEAASRRIHSDRKAA